MLAVSRSVLLAFSSGEERRTILRERYPTFFALAVASADAKIGVAVSAPQRSRVVLRQTVLRPTMRRYEPFPSCGPDAAQPSFTFEEIQRFLSHPTEIQPR